MRELENGNFINIILKLFPLFQPFWETDVLKAQFCPRKICSLNAGAPKNMETIFIFCKVLIKTAAGNRKHLYFPIKKMKLPAVLNVQLAI